MRCPQGLWEAPTYSLESRKPLTCGGQWECSGRTKQSYSLTYGWPWGSAQAGSEAKERVVNSLAEDWRKCQHPPTAPQQSLEDECLQPFKEISVQPRAYHSINQSDTSVVVHHKIYSLHKVSLEKSVNKTQNMKSGKNMIWKITMLFKVSSFQQKTSETCKKKKGKKKEKERKAHTFLSLGTIKARKEWGEISKV